MNGISIVIPNADYSSVAFTRVAFVTDAPTISVTAGVVSITAENVVAIYYTTDGSEPTQTSKVYTSTFSVDEGTTIKAVGKKADGSLTKVSEETYWSSEFNKFIVHKYAFDKDMTDAKGGTAFSQGVISNGGYNSQKNKQDYVAISPLTEGTVTIRITPTIVRDSSSTQYNGRLMWFAIYSSSDVCAPTLSEYKTGIDVLAFMGPNVTATGHTNEWSVNFGYASNSYFGEMSLNEESIVMVTFSKTDGCKVYINGTLKGSLKNMEYNVDMISLGTGWSNAVDANSKRRDLRVYNKAFSEREISELYEELIS